MTEHVNGSIGHANQLRLDDFQPCGPPMIPAARKSCRHCHGRGHVGTLMIGERIQCRCVILVPVRLEVPPPQEPDATKVVLE